MSIAIWTRDASNPVLGSDDASAEAWEAINLFKPFVAELGDGSFRMWYSGGDNYADNLYAIGTATSPDGVTWTRPTATNPVFTPTGADTFDRDGVMEPFVLQEGSTWKMWYTGQRGAGATAGPNATNEIGYATSTDGLTWTRQNGGNPVVANGGGGSADEYWAAKAWVLPNAAGGGFVMWYTGLGASGTWPSVLRATSADGVTWTKTGVVLTSPGEFLLYPCVLREPDGTLTMYLQRGTGSTGYETYRYASSDGVSWSEAGLEFSRTASGTWADSYIGTPCVVDTTRGRMAWLAGRMASEAGVYRYRRVGAFRLRRNTAGAPAI